MADRPRGTLFVGVTTDLLQAVFEHRDGQTEQYGLGMLAYYEEHTVPAFVIRRERELKTMRQKDRVAMIESVNPKWDDLWEEITHRSPVAS